MKSASLTELLYPKRVNVVKAVSFVPSFLEEEGRLVLRTRGRPHCHFGARKTRGFEQDGQKPCTSRRSRVRQVDTHRVLYARLPAQSVLLVPTAAVEGSSGWKRSQGVDGKENDETNRTTFDLEEQRRDAFAQFSIRDLTEHG